MEQPRLLQLRDWQEIKQNQALAAVGTPQAADFLAESKRYKIAQDFIDELQAEIARLSKKPEESAWIKALKEELLMSKMTHSFNLSRNECMEMLNMFPFNAKESVDELSKKECGKT